MVNASEMFVEKWKAQREKTGKKEGGRGKGNEKRRKEREKNGWQGKEERNAFNKS